MSQHRADTLLPRDKGTAHDLQAYNQTQAELRSYKQLREFNS